MTKKLPKRGLPPDGQRSPLPQVRRTRQLAVRGAHNRVGRAHRLTSHDLVPHCLEGAG